MSEFNKTLCVRFLDALGVGDTEVLGEVMHQDFQAIAKGQAGISGSRGRDLVMETCRSFFPTVTQAGLNPKIISMTAEDDRVAVEWEAHCTLVNGTAYNQHYTFVFYIHEHKILKIHEYFDTKLTDTALLPLLNEMGLGH